MLKAETTLSVVVFLIDFFGLHLVSHAIVARVPYKGERAADDIMYPNKIHLLDVNPTKSPES